MSPIYRLPYIERIRIVRDDGKRMRYQNLPFWERMKKKNLALTIKLKSKPGDCGACL